MNYITENRKRITLISINIASMVMKENDRINLFIQYLIRTSRFSSQEEVGKYLGYENKSSFSQLLKKEITNNFLEKLTETFPEYVNFKIGIYEDPQSMALTSLDNIIKNKNNRQPEGEGRVISDSELVEVFQYVVPIKGQAGLNKAFFYPDEYIEENFVKESILVKPSERGKYLKIEVEGNSMPNVLNPGDWARCEEIPKLHWLDKNIFKPKKVYCLFHNKRGILFKRISKVFNDTITLSSDNSDKSEYPDEIFNLIEFSKILIVRKVEKDV